MQPILYKSTRISPGGTQEEAVGIETAIARGMPSDGGLYVPTCLPTLPSRVFAPEPLPYAELARLVLEPFFPGWGDSLAAILDHAYARGGSGRFDTPLIAPISPLPGLGADSGASIYLLELSHGRTCAFKDMALSVLGGLLRESLDRLGKKEPILVLTATSGDTGSAALEGLSGIRGVHTAVFYPHGGTSEIQRLQMTTVGKEGNFVAGLEGNFDDAQNAVKSVFGRASRGEGPLAKAFLSSANSINIGRLLPQIVYYVAAWRDLASRGVLGPGNLMHVSVPTGNFGDILAAKYAKEMGLPIGSLICASNANKVLSDFFATGVYDRKRELLKTDSPSMDILVSSNLERLLSMASGGNPARVSKLMGDLAALGRFEIDAREKAYIGDFKAGWCSDYSAGSVIAETWRSCGIFVDPHTATAVEVAVRTAGALRPVAPIVAVSTASPFKFPRACLEALGEPTRAAGAASSAAEKGATADLGLAGDLGLAARLAEITGQAMPEPIRMLATEKVLHDRVLKLSEVETALEAYVGTMLAGKS